MLSVSAPVVPDETGELPARSSAHDVEGVAVTTVTFAEEGPNSTRVTVTWEPHGKVTPEEMAVFVKGRSGMNMGWGGSFDKLEDYLRQSK